jgi:hypothetical protein
LHNSEGDTLLDQTGSINCWLNVASSPAGCGSLRPWSRARRSSHYLTNIPRDPVPPKPN